jgi:uncharacterized protein (TIGR00159 family)
LNDGIIAKIIDFIREIFAGLDSGYLFFGGPAEIVRYVADILLITFVLYQALKLLRETRAWQLLQGLFLIVLFTMVCSLLGLEMVGFLFDNILYVVAIAFVVIFQPELRRALETVGLKSFSTFSNAFSPDYQDAHNNLSVMIDQVVMACSEMARTYTGALIIIERNSKLGELIEHENVVPLDSSVTNSILQSIFYRGSPLHDGAVLIRNSRIAAARCHVPLSESVHSMINFGTRHRAAVGASEMGDAVAIAVSEERGKISLAIDGCLYEMRGGDELRKNLLFLFGVSNTSGRFVRRKHGDKASLKRNKSAAQKANSDNIDVIMKEKASGLVEGEIVAVAGACAIDNSTKPSKSSNMIELPITAKKTGNSFDSMGRTRKILYLLLSFLISLGLWMYIQINTNPVVETTIVVPMQYKSADTLKDKNLECPFTIEDVEVMLVGRKKVIEAMVESDIMASIDLSQINEVGFFTLPIEISTEKDVYYRVKQQSPEDIPVVVYTAKE